MLEVGSAPTIPHGMNPVEDSPAVFSHQLLQTSSGASLRKSSKNSGVQYRVWKQFKRCGCKMLFTSQVEK